MTAIDVSRMRRQSRSVALPQFACCWKSLIPNPIFYPIVSNYEGFGRL